MEEIELLDAIIAARDQFRAQQQAAVDAWRDAHLIALQESVARYRVLVDTFFVKECQVYLECNVPVLSNTQTHVPVFQLRQGKQLSEFASNVVTMMIQHHEAIRQEDFHFSEAVFGYGGLWGPPVLVRLSSGDILSMGARGFFQYTDYEHIFELPVEWFGHAFRPSVREVTTRVFQTDAANNAPNPFLISTPKSVFIYFSLVRGSHQHSNGIAWCDDYLGFIETFANQFPSPLAYTISSEVAKQMNLRNLASPAALGRFVKGLQRVSFSKIVVPSELWSVMEPLAFEDLHFDMHAQVPESFLLATQAKRITWQSSGYGGYDCSSLTCLSRRIKNPLLKLAYTEHQGINCVDAAIEAALPGVREFEIYGLGFMHEIVNPLKSMWRKLEDNVTLCKITLFIYSPLGPRIRHLETIKKCLAKNYILEEIHLKDRMSAQAFDLSEPEATFWNEEIQSQLTLAGWKKRITRELFTIKNETTRAALVPKILLRFQHNPMQQMIILKLHLFPPTT
jgi:hypothetical protein